MINSIQTQGDLKGRRVLVRVDFNVPIKNKIVLDDTRIRAALPTIRFLTGQGAAVILVSHLGRPGGKPVSRLSLGPVAVHLSKLLRGKTVSFLKLNSTTQKRIQNLKPKEVVLLENIRFFPGEEKNDPVLARQLSELADMFVFDGFGVAHRDAASVSGVPKFIPSFAGLLVEHEIKQLDVLLNRAKSPFIAVLGGAKMETKLPLIQKFLNIADEVLIGGALVNTILFSKGYGVGKSLLDEKYTKEAARLFSKRKLVLPIDVMVGTPNGRVIRVVNIEKKPHQICKQHEAILDIGPASAALFANYIQTAKTVLLNGAMGYFENRSYALGTYTVTQALADNRSAFCVAGGGETVEVLERLKLLKKIDFVSTGGGAMLEYLSGRSLPGLKGLKQ